MAGPLKLHARDAEDLEVIAACVQDALVTLGEMMFVPAEKRFVMVVNRFRWETADAVSTVEVAARDSDATFEDERPGPTFERVHAGLCFDGVTTVRMRGIDPRGRGRILEFLGLVIREPAIDLIFAGGVSIRLEVEELRCRLEDLDEPWPTRWRPRHRFDDEGSAEA